MSFQIIDGKAIAGEIRSELKAKVVKLIAEGVVPGLAIILVGNHPPSEIYVRGKRKASQEVGISSKLIRFTKDVTEEELLNKIAKLNQDSSVHGILVQLPLPNHISTKKVVEEISPEKDVDGFHPYNVGRFMIGYESFTPCTPQGIMELLRRSNISLKGKHAVVIGRSNIVGKPISILLQKENATVTMCHSRTSDLRTYTKEADLIVCAVGVEKLIRKRDVKPGVVIVDVGMNRTKDGKLVGDVDFDEVAPLTSAITPVPGGVGPMTIAMLLNNTVQSATIQLKDEF